MNQTSDNQILMEKLGSEQHIQLVLFAERRVFSQRQHDRERQVGCCWKIHMIPITAAGLALEDDADRAGCFHPR